MSTDDFPGADIMDAAEIQQLTAIARSLTEADHDLDPVPDDLWSSIEAELELEQAHIAPAQDNVTSMDRHRRAWRPLAAVAAVAAVIAGVVGITVAGNGDDPELVAQTDFDALADGFDGSAVVNSIDGGLELVLDIGDLPADDGFYELWLIKDLETGQMQSLGPIDGSGTVAWPEGFDPAEYAVVDISIEPRDGVPTHSGVSVLRGTLES